ncbi:hypothetical protein ACWEV4_02415 [Streptomyces sp. NPDC003860]
MLLRRYHKPRPEPDAPDTGPDSAKDAPQADTTKPAGRSRSRTKPTGG